MINEFVPYDMFLNKNATEISHATEISLLNAALCSSKPKLENLMHLQDLS